MNSFFDVLEKDIEDLQKSIDKLSDSATSVNEHHESLKKDTIEIANTDISDDLNSQIVEMTEYINIQMKHTEDMLVNLMDPERLKYMSDMSKMQQQFIDQGK